MTKIVESVVTTRERETYEAMWAIDAYRKHSPGERWAPLFLDMIEYLPNTPTSLTILDAGCGCARGALTLQKAGLRVGMCDLTPDGIDPEAKNIPFFQATLWDDLRVGVQGFVDYVYCTDVLEHLPLSLTMLAVHRMLEVSRKGVFLTIALTPESYGFFIGKPGLHQSLQSYVQWRDQLGAIAHVREARDLLLTGAYLLEPR